MGKIKDRIVALVKAKTGLDISGYSSVVNSSEIWHSFKNHSDVSKETLRGQIPVTEADYALIPEIVSNPDDVWLSDTLDGNGRQTIFFVKKMGGQYVVLEGYSTKKKALGFDDMWIMKGSLPPRPTADDSSTKGQRPKRSDGTAPDSSGSNLPQASDASDGRVALTAPNLTPEAPHAYQSNPEGTADLSAGPNVPQNSDSVKTGANDNSQDAAGVLADVASGNEAGSGPEGTGNGYDPVSALMGETGNPGDTGRRRRPGRTTPGAEMNEAFDALVDEHGAIPPT